MNKNIRGVFFATAVAFFAGSFLIACSSSSSGGGSQSLDEAGSAADISSHEAVAQRVLLINPALGLSEGLAFAPADRSIELVKGLDCPGTVDTYSGESPTNNPYDSIVYEGEGVYLDDCAISDTISLDYDETFIGAAQLLVDDLSGDQVRMARMGEPGATFISDRMQRENDESEVWEWSAEVYENQDPDPGESGFYAQIDFESTQWDDGVVTGGSVFRLFGSESAGFAEADLDSLEQRLRAGQLTIGVARNSAADVCPVPGSFTVTVNETLDYGSFEPEYLPVVGALTMSAGGNEVTVEFNGSELTVTIDGDEQMFGATELAAMAPVVSACLGEAAELVDPEILVTNGPLFSCTDCGSDGAPASELPSGFITFGAAAYKQVIDSEHFRMADDFIIPEGTSWGIDEIIVYAYQTNSDTTSTFTGLNFQIWDGPPDDPASTVVFGDMDTNRMTATGWTGVYRTGNDDLGNTLRPIMWLSASIDLALGAGTYWLDWQAEGSLASGPWAPAVPFPVTTANSMQLISTGWSAFTDGSGSNLELPFQVRGESVDQF